MNTFSPWTQRGYPSLPKSQVDAQMIRKTCVTGPIDANRRTNSVVGLVFVTFYPLKLSCGEPKNKHCVQHSSFSEYKLLLSNYFHGLLVLKRDSGHRAATDMLCGEEIKVKSYICLQWMKLILKCVFRKATDLLRVHSFHALA